MIASEAQSLNASLERAILMGLAAEWTAAVEELPGRWRRVMRAPLFSIREMGARLGHWHPVRKEIAVSRRLVSKHPWDAVKDVLLHETAHQLAHEMPGGLEDPPHGRVFRHACRLLRADPRASGTYPVLQNRISAGSLQENDRLLLRIRKLLALATSRNRYEAEAAMKKAHDLIRRFNIDLQRDDTRRSFVSLFLGRPALRHFREVYHLAGLLQEYYFVQGIWVSAWVVEKERMGRVLEISGTCANVQMASYVHDFVYRFIDAEWRRYNPAGALNRYRKTDFAVGVVEGFREKLAADQAGSTREESRALVRLTDPLLNRYVRQRYPRIRSFQRTEGRQDPAIIEDGKRRGRKLVIARGVEDRGTDSRPRLPAGPSKNR